METQHIKLNIQYDLQEFRDYYNTLETEYPHKKWIATEQKDNILPYRFGKTYGDLTRCASGFSIQTYLPSDSPILPAPWNVVSDLKTDGRTPTEMLFGPAQRIVDKIPMAYRLGLSVMRPNGFIEYHRDDAWHVHFPIYSPENSVLTFDDEEGVAIDEYYYPEGECWAINTLLMHSVYNRNLTDNRVHMFFSVRDEDIQSLVDLVGEGMTI